MMGFMTFLVLLVAIYGAIVHNQWAVFSMLLFFVGMGLVTQWLGRWLQSQTSEYKLLPDRMVIDGIEVKLEDIASIQWPKKRSNECQSIKLNLETPDSEELANSISIPINKFERADQLLFVQYLQQQECKHVDWSTFCSKYVDPWLASSGRKLWSDELNAKLKKSPFWTTFFYTPYICAIFALAISSWVYWTLGAAFALSAVINIRLMHGDWMQPVGQTVLGCAAFLMILGTISAFFPQFKKPKSDVSSPDEKAGRWAGLILVVSIIVGPWIVQSLVLAGFRNLGLIVLETFPWIPCIPFVIEHWRRRKSIQKNPDAAYERAAANWERHCQKMNGTLNEPVDEPWIKRNVTDFDVRDQVLKQF